MQPLITNLLKKTIYQSDIWGGFMTINSDVHKMQRFFGQRLCVERVSYAKQPKGGTLFILFLDGLYYK